MANVNIDDNIGETRSCIGCDKKYNANDDIINVIEQEIYQQQIVGCSKQVRNFISFIDGKYFLSSLALWICVLILPTIVFGQQTDNDICMQHFHRFNPSHTACLKPNGKCRITKRGVSKADQKMILDVHNYYRNLIASGNESRLGFPSAANMLTLEWDDELAYVAQKHADQCRFQHDCYDCRRTGQYPVVGQNLYTYQTTRSSADPNWKFIIKEWYDEIKIAPPSVAQSFDLFRLNIGHFTQIAWAETNRIGCGYVTYSKAGEGIFKTGQLYTCNYAPGGNFLGEKMYENGVSASKCPPKYNKSKKFHALCEFIAWSTLTGTSSVTATSTNLITNTTSISTRTNNQISTQTTGTTTLRTNTNRTRTGITTRTRTSINTRTRNGNRNRGRTSIQKNTRISTSTPRTITTVYTKPKNIQSTSTNQQGYYSGQPVYPTQPSPAAHSSPPSYTYQSTYSTQTKPTQTSQFPQTYQPYYSTQPTSNVQVVNQPKPSTNYFQPAEPSRIPSQITSSTYQTQPTLSTYYSQPSQPTQPTPTTFQTQPVSNIQSTYQLQPVQPIENNNVDLYSGTGYDRANIAIDNANYVNNNNNINNINNNNNYKWTTNWGTRLNNWKTDGSSTTYATTQPTITSGTTSTNTITSNPGTTSPLQESSLANWKWDTSNYDWNKWLTNYTKFTDWSNWSTVYSINDNKDNTNNNNNNNNLINNNKLRRTITSNRWSNNNGQPIQSINRISNISVPWWTTWSNMNNYHQNNQIGQTNQSPQTETRVPTYKWSLTFGTQKDNNPAVYNWSRTIDMTPNHLNANLHQSNRHTNTNNKYYNYY